MLRVFHINLFSHFASFFSKRCYIVIIWPSQAKDWMHHSCEINIMLCDLLKCLINVVDDESILCLACNN